MTPVAPSDDRMSDVDKVLWVIEANPQLRSTITAVLYFDQPPDRGSPNTRVERASRRIGWLRQRVVSNHYSLAPPRWEVDPAFNLSYHLRWAHLGGSGTRRRVLSQRERFHDALLHGLQWRHSFAMQTTGGLVELALDPVQGARRTRPRAQRGRNSERRVRRRVVPRSRRVARATCPAHRCRVLRRRRDDRHGGVRSAQRHGDARIACLERGIDEMLALGRPARRSSEAKNTKPRR